MNERPANISINAELPDTIQRKDGETVDSLVVKQDKNGTDRIYTLNEAGKHQAISANAIVQAYGYDPNETQDSNDPFTPDPTATSIDTTPERPDQDLYDEYAEAVKDESATVRVRNPETGKMEVTKVKDLNFREWIKQSEMRKAAKWYTATRAHGEGLVEGIDYATEAPLPLDLTNEELDKLDNTEHAEQLNAREGKPNPSDDDVEYYRWLKDADQARMMTKLQDRLGASKHQGVQEGNNKTPEAPVVTPEVPEEDGRPEPPTQPVPVVVTPEGPTKPEKIGWFERNKRNILRAGALGAVALAGILGLSSAKEDKGLDLDIGNHGKDIHQVVEIDETEDALRRAGVDVDTRHEIASDFDTATEFFSPKTGTEAELAKKNFETMVSTIDKEAAKFKELHGDAITKKYAHDLAEQKVAAGLKALGASDFQEAVADYAKTYNPAIDKPLDS